MEIMVAGIRVDIEGVGRAKQAHVTIYPELFITLKNRPEKAILWSR
jgi:hypothetical protein